MLYIFYVLPFWFVCFGIICAILLWSKIMAISERQQITTTIFKICSVVCLMLSLCLVLYATVYGRHEARGISLIPFRSLKEAKTQPEIYRTMLMNLALFVPFGLSLTSCITRRFSIKQRTFLTLIFAFILSSLIEASQYIFALGIFQTDDIICNTCGALLGTLSLQLRKHFINSYLYDLEFI
ncbi:MAG: VanZ family protein [Ruminococcaceae bacterium]|nr:VanZ family protein [Oscillospiraceae bacterium]